MAKLELSLDTETKAWSLTIDGQEVEYARCVEACQWPDEDYDDDSGWQPHFTVTTDEKVGGVSRRVYLTASRRGRPEGKASASRFPGVLEVREDAVASAMEQLVAARGRR